MGCIRVGCPLSDAMLLLLAWAAALHAALVGVDQVCRFFTYPTARTLPLRAA